MARKLPNAMFPSGRGFSANAYARNPFKSEMEMKRQWRRTNDFSDDREQRLVLCKCNDRGDEREGRSDASKFRNNGRY